MADLSIYAGQAEFVSCVDDIPAKVAAQRYVGKDAAMNPIWIFTFLVITTAAMALLLHPVQFQQPTLWEQYPGQIAVIIAALLAQAALILVLLREHRRRQIAEVQARRRMAELAHVNRFSTAGELTTSIAHEINQPLTAILNNAETANAILQSSAPTSQNSSIS